MKQEYLDVEPTRAELEQLRGTVLVEFGAPWCGYCKCAQPAIADALKEFSAIRHFKVADGRGQPLGRSFRVKLWPTLIVMRDGQEVGRVVRPSGRKAISEMLSAATAGAAVAERVH